jgi:hypothetical protein
LPKSRATKELLLKSAVGRSGGLLVLVRRPATLCV